MHTYLAILSGNGADEAALCACRAALAATPADEELQARLGRYVLSPEAVEEEGPAPNRQAYYAKLMEAGQMLSDSLEALRRDIASQNSAQGALLCDYDMFREIYVLHMRNLERLGTSMYLALIMVGAVAGELSASRQDEIMQELGQLLQESLRKGDTIAQVNANTYAVMLPTVNRNSSIMVMERLKRAFSQRYPGDGLIMAYRVGPVSEYRALRKGKGKDIC